MQISRIAEEERVNGADVFRVLIYFLPVFSRKHKNAVRVPDALFAIISLPRVFPRRGRGSGVPSLRSQFRKRRTARFHFAFRPFSNVHTLYIYAKMTPSRGFATRNRARDCGYLAN